MHITLRQILIFTEILKNGSTTQASQVLALSQSAVSAALADLENQMGVQLFDRTGKRLILNEYGRLLYPYAQGLLEQAREIEHLFSQKKGAIRLYASSTIGNYILPEMLARYRRQFPELPVELSVGNSRDVINAIIDFRVDIGLIEGPCPHNDVICLPWLTDELVIFCAPQTQPAKQPVSLAELAEARWILREQGSGTREIVNYLLLSHLPKFQLELELGNSEAIKHAVRHGMGISCLSRRVIEEQLNNGSLVEIQTELPPLSRTLWLIHHRQKPLSRALMRFFDCCTEQGAARLNITNN